jgi:ribonuclease III
MILHKKLKKFLGFNPGELNYYKIAFRHSSASINNKSRKINNERLEFIGDAVLNMLVADTLYIRLPFGSEGNLSLVRSKLVCRKNLNQIAQNINLTDFVICKNTNPGVQGNIGGNAFEALFGAIYYAKGYKYCKKFAKKHLLTEESLKELSNDKEDYKSQIINFAQKKKINIKFNTIENCEANEKIQHFKSELFINENYLTEGKGWSKKEAEQDAAKKAILLPQKCLMEIANRK